MHAISIRRFLHGKGLCIARMDSSPSLNDAHSSTADFTGAARLMINTLSPTVVGKNAGGGCPDPVGEENPTGRKWIPNEQ